jgi:ParB family chromosome partitioning protein
LRQWNERGLNTAINGPARRAAKDKEPDVPTKIKRVKTTGINNTHDETTASDGAPLMIDMDLIDEDPLQPRSQNNPGFSQKSIAELAASFGPRGPKSPISLRDNRDSPGRYIINHGHRRYRAAKVKGLRIIPAFIDNDYNEVDQVIENLQRNELTPREIADWIGRKIAKGVKKSDIGKSIGKSAAFVSQHAALLNLPVPIAEAFASGRVNDVTVVNELATAYKKHPEKVGAWLDDAQQEVTRGGVKLLRAFLGQDGAESTLQVDGQEDEDSARTTAELTAAHRGSKTSDKIAESDRLKKAIVLVEHNGRPARLLLRRRPTSVGMAWLRYEDDGQGFESRLSEVKLVAIIEGSM